MIPEPFLKPYNPAENEEEVYARWEKSGFFDPDTCIKEEVAAEDAEHFSIVLPPPNVTGTLHMGHAAMLAVEDIVVRYNRMRGKKTLWVPGTDHAAIATQSKVEGELYKKEKKMRHDLGREEFLKRVEKFAKESHDTIVNQVRRMGASVDWSREAYTLDEARNLAVRTAFKRMYDDGLIYRGARIVNWDPSLQTTVSDDEIEWVERTEPFYYLTYGPFTIATARPETKFGDKFVVMHPDDERYAKFKQGQKIELEWINGPITATVLKDEAANMEFGTGAMTITPAHDLTDFEIAERHGLEKERVINERGILLPIAGEFAGQHIKKARSLIVEKLKSKGLLEKIDETYVHNVATNSRGGGLIEPQIKEQWFVAVNKPFTIKHSDIKGVPLGSQTTLKSLMRAAVENGQIDILPDHFEKVYYHWIDNLRDWCISRQLWYGHRIPVWYHEPLCIPKPGREADVEKCIMMLVSNTEPTCEFCDAKYIQDPDTLDTWFSSGLWTFSTLGWPEDTSDLKTYHPTTLLETGYDILFFWVARMILMTTYHLGTIPFRTVYLHGLVRDGKGRKMSKSLGNIIDPLDMIAKYGADATRLSLTIGAAPGVDIRLSEERVRGYKHFANKLWNIARFVLTAVDGTAPSEKPVVLPEHQAHLDEFAAVANDITKDIDGYRLHLAGEKLYHYAWSRFADVILEESKPTLKGNDLMAKASMQWTLYFIFTDLLKLAHPFAPFVTERIWSLLPETDQFLMVTRWPVSK